MKYTQRRTEQLALELVVARLLKIAPDSPEVVHREEPFTDEEARKRFEKYHEGFWECLDAVSTMATEWGRRHITDTTTRV